jgi:hypothetical protein
MNRLKHNDRGQITTAFVMVGTVMVLALGMWAAKLGQATDQKSHVQIAADAAALAGAQQIKKDAPGQILAAITAGGVGDFNCDLGQAAATDFAIRAGASVLTYCYSSGTGIVTVSVASLTNSVSGKPAIAHAKARVGPSLANCVLPKPKPVVPPDTTDTAVCGSQDIPIVIHGDGSPITIVPGFDIGGLFTPALIS